MYKVKAVSRFCAAHFLDNYKGKCEALHGHNWKVEALAASKRLDGRGMVIDFRDLRRLLNDVLAVLDHRLLNDISFFKGRNTTSELIAQYIFIELNKKLTRLKKTRKVSFFFLEEVIVWEQEDSCALYAPRTKR